MSNIVNALRAQLRSSPSVMRMYRKYFGSVGNRRYFGRLDVHETMVADAVRNEAYRRAIARHVQPGDVVVDLGTGTGLLAFFAAAAGARKVYAIDHSNVLPTARRLADENGIRNVEFIKVNSRRFTPAEPVDVIVHEQMSNDLFSENMIANVTDLRNRILKPGGMILPGRFDLHIEPVKLKDDYRLPFLWEQNDFSIRYDSLKAEMEGAYGKAYHRRVISPGDVDYLLTTPETALSLDLHTMDEADLPKTLGLKRRIVREGRLDGFCMFFTARFDDEIDLSTSPAARRTHWGLPLFRTATRLCRPGDTLTFEAALTPISAPSSWEWRSSDDRPADFRIPRPGVPDRTVGADVG